MLGSVAASETQGRKGSPPSERGCIVTRASAPRAGLVRFVRGPENVVVPDLAETLPGRGVWITAERSAVETAQAKNLFAHAFRAPAKAPADLPERIERLLAERCIALIGLARRADAIVFGGGIGENAAEIRTRICHGLDWCGVWLDHDRNRAAVGLTSGSGAKISRDGSHPGVFVVAADEESWIARETVRCLKPA